MSGGADAVLLAWKEDIAVRLLAFWCNCTTLGAESGFLPLGFKMLLVEHHMSNLEPYE